MSIAGLAAGLAMFTIETLIVAALAGAAWVVAVIVLALL